MLIPDKHIKHISFAGERPQNLNFYVLVIEFIKL